MKKILHSKWWWLPTLLVGVGLYFMAEWSNVRVDLTVDQRFTISQPTRTLLQQLPQQVTISVLLGEEGLPAAFVKLSLATESFLATLKAQNHNKIVYKFIDANEFMTDSVGYPFEDSLKVSWLKANALKQNEVTKSGTKASFVYPLAVVASNDRFALVNLLQGQGEKGFLNPDAALLQREVVNRAEAQMEYYFAAAIQSLSEKRIPRIAYTVGHGEPMGAETYDLSQNLRSRYQFYLLNLSNQAYISDSLDVVVMVKPNLPFNDADKLKLDQFLMRGGKLLFLLDALHADMDSLVQTGKDFTAYPRNCNLEDLLFRYGARVNIDLVTDRQSDVLPQTVGVIGNQPQIELLPWPYFPLLYSTSNHPISKNLDAVVMQFPNSLDTVKAEGIKKEILLSSSNTTRVVGAPVIVTVEILKQLENPSAFQQQHIPLAILLEGSFKSLYTNRLAGALADSFALTGRNFLTSGSAEGKILVTGDGDWVLNAMSKEGPLAMGANPYTRYPFANRDFLLNTIDYFTDASGIMTTRSREFILRLLDPKKLETQTAGWQWFNIGMPLFILLIASFWVQWVRKRRYAPQM